MRRPRSTGRLSEARAPDQAPRPRQRLPRRSLDARRRPARSRRRGSRACATAAAASAPTACSSALPPADARRRDLHDGPVQRRRRPGRDERQRHPLPRPRPWPRPRHRRGGRCACATDAGAARPSTSQHRPTTPARARAASTWAGVGRRAAEPDGRSRVGARRASRQHRRHRQPAPRAARRRSRRGRPRRRRARPRAHVPDGINVEFIAPRRPTAIRPHAVWERGAGITEACGTGALCRGRRGTDVGPRRRAGSRCTCRAATASVDVGDHGPR